MPERSHKTIYRVDLNTGTQKRHGWSVSLTWDSKRYQKWFSDQRYGSIDAALDAAIEWRDRKEIELGKPRTENRIVRSKVKHKYIYPDRRGGFLVRMTWNTRSLQAYIGKEDGIEKALDRRTELQEELGMPLTDRSE